VSKKTFKEKTGHLDRFFSRPEESNRIHETDETGTPKYYRLNLKLKSEYKEYLDHVSWQNKKSITQYLNDLIQADKIENDIRGT
jgi:hypothetical protein